MRSARYPKSQTPKGEEDKYFSTRYFLESHVYTTASLDL